MSTVYGLVRRNGGAIAVESELRCGSTFRVYFPLLSHRTAAARAMSSADGEGAVVVIAEDEPLVRELMVSTLERAGFTAVGCQDGLEASRRIAQLERVDALVSDAVMPGITGVQLAEQLRARFPAARIVFVSGYAVESLAEQRLLGAHDMFLMKPFSMDDLLRALDRGGGTRGVAIELKPPSVVPG
jgi:CheY-like chemotaxis protein